MKRICTLFALLGCLPAARAQRMVDLQVTMTSPSAGMTIAPGTQLDLNGVIKNGSTNLLKATDTLLLSYTLDGGAISFYVNGQNVTTFEVTGRQLSLNDTMQYNRSFTIDPGSSLLGRHTFCLVAFPSNTSADSVRDPVPANNAGCITVTVSNTPSGVAAVTGAPAVNRVAGLYPVPAGAELTVNLALGSNSPVTIRLADLTGRVVLSQSSGMLPKGERTIMVSTAGLSDGLYLYEVVMGGDRSTGKLRVSR